MMNRARAHEHRIERSRAMGQQHDYSAIMHYSAEDIRSEENARQALESIHVELGSFHPDDRGAEIVGASGARVFTDEQAQRYDEVMDAIHRELGERVYDIALAYLNDEDND
jgi:hypothetical protein